MAGNTWPGVGHKNPSGGGTLNAFGKVRSTYIRTGRFSAIHLVSSLTPCSSTFQTGIMAWLPTPGNVNDKQYVPIVVPGFAKHFSVFRGGLQSCSGLIVSSSPSRLSRLIRTLTICLQDFKAAGEKWTKELCEKDSDGDGFTNGQELGDPTCTWKPGQPQIELETILSQPGVATSVPA